MEVEAMTQTARFAVGAGWNPSRERGNGRVRTPRIAARSRVPRRKLFAWKTRTGPPGLTPLWARDQSVSWGVGEAVRSG